VICPACQTAHGEPAPRFCDGCGLALPRVRPAPSARRLDPAESLVRCPDCGTPATARRCRACGARVRWPEDMLPPDEEAPGKPPAPALELEDDSVAIIDVPLDDDPPEGH
jgi:hypothetical protein